MSNQWAAPTYTDGDFTVAKACSLPQLLSPIPSTSDPFILTQEWCINLLNYAPLALGTAHPSSGLTPDYSAYKLVEEGPRQDMGNGAVKWTRTYAKPPSSHDEWESYVYNFIGTAPIGPLSTSQVGRKRFSDRVTSRVQNDYFMLGVAVTDPISGATYTPSVPGGIEQIFAFQYVAQQDDPSGAQGTDFGGLGYNQDSVCDQFQAITGGYLYASVPNATQYVAQIKDATDNGWSASKSWQKITSGSPPIITLTSLAYYGSGSASTSVTSLFGQIVAENSILERWQGNIYRRKTRWVLAQ